MIHQMIHRFDLFLKHKILDQYVEGGVVGIS
jgi:hypothetical protein